VGQPSAGRQGYREKKDPTDKADQLKSPSAKSQSISAGVVRSVGDEIYHFHLVSPF
jgi:hypothetical protein